MCQDHMKWLPAKIPVSVFRPDFFFNLKNVLIFLEFKSILIMNVETAEFLEYNFFKKFPDAQHVLYMC